MDGHISDYYREFSEESPNGKFHKVISLQDPSEISWDQAIDEITKKLMDIRENDGPDALHFNGSAKVSTEIAYLQRKFAAFWGSNNIDHQARI